MCATILHFTFLAYIVFNKATGMLECTLVSISIEMLCSIRRNMHRKYIPRNDTEDTCCFVLWS